MDIKRKLDELLTSSCPDESPYQAGGMVDAWLERARSEFSVLRKARRILSAGSFVSGTAIRDSSGMDVLFVPEGLPPESPDSALLELEESLPPLAGSRSRHGLMISHGELGRICLMPAFLDESDCGMMIPDTELGAWVPAIPSEHAQAIRRLDPLDLCAIRLAKYWNCNHPGGLESFHLEAIALEALTSTSILTHIHWKLKWIFDTAHRSVSAGHGHPLALDRVKFNYLSDEARARALIQIDRARGLASNAWFLMEMKFDEADNLKGAVGAYAALLDPSLLCQDPPCTSDAN